MNSKQLIEMLRSGKQEPVKLTINTLRDKEQLAEKIAGVLEADKSSIMQAINDASHSGKTGFTSENIMTMFIPNTYEIMWNISPSELIKKMNNEYKTFWNHDRMLKASAINLRPSEVTILASIVELETYKKDERSSIAGVYLNRLKKGMLLQADPTVIFATGDYSIKRVLGKHLSYDSPYNTYMYKGLPPGPICLPSVNSIDAVLNYKKSGYLYFCAREDFSGYHNFATTVEEHKINARKYQRELNRRKIMN